MVYLRLIKGDIMGQIRKQSRAEQEGDIFPFGDVVCPRCKREVSPWVLPRRHCSDKSWALCIRWLPVKLVAKMRAEEVKRGRHDKI